MTKRRALLVFLISMLLSAPGAVRAGSLVFEDGIREFMGDQQLFGFDVMQLDECLRQNDVGIINAAKLNAPCRSLYGRAQTEVLRYASCLDDLLAAHRVPKLMYPYGDYSNVKLLLLRTQIAETLAVDMGYKTEVQSKCITPLKQQ